MKPSINEQDLKATIKAIAVDHFNRNGYHGTTIRTIASEAGCSLPMVYYYYSSKRELFHEIIKNDYFAILSREANKLTATDILDFYTQFIMNVMNLNEHDRKIYRLGIKVYLSFDGDEQLLEIMETWEASILPRHRALILPHLADDPHAEGRLRTLMHLLENLIERIVVKDMLVSEQDIREELAIVLGRT
jgi:AcrR family transcriptional regulator